jgi:hypothetical protein
MGRSSRVEDSETLVGVHQSPSRSVCLRAMSQKDGSARTNYSNTRFRGGEAESRLCDHIGGALRSSDAYWKSIGLSVERLSNGLFIGEVQTIGFVFDSTPNHRKYAWTEYLESCCEIVSSTFSTKTRVPCFSTGPNTRSHRD